MTTVCTLIASVPDHFSTSARVERRKKKKKIAAEVDLISVSDSM